jgi:hypothetical protein
MTPGERVAKANRASEVLKELDWVFKEVRDDITKALESSALGDVDTHHNLTISLQILKQIQAKLQATVNDGKMAQAEQEQDNWIRRMRRRG